MIYHNKIKRLDIKATHESDIPTKLVKRFDNIVVDYLQENFNNCLKGGTFPKDFKKDVFTPPIKGTVKQKNQTIDRLALCLIYLKFIDDLYMTKCILISVIFSLSINVASVTNIVHNTTLEQ